MMECWQSDCVYYMAELKHQGCCTNENGWQPSHGKDAYFNPCHNFKQKAEKPDPPEQTCPHRKHDPQLNLWMCERNIAWIRKCEEPLEPIYDCNGEGNRPSDPGRRLAGQHWEYLNNVLLIHGLEKSDINTIGYHYRTAFIHGYKHGLQDSIQKPWGWKYEKTPKNQED